MNRISRWKFDFKKKDIYIVSKYPPELFIYYKKENSNLTQETSWSYFTSTKESKLTPILGLIDITWLLKRCTKKDTTALHWYSCPKRTVWCIVSKCQNGFRWKETKKTQELEAYIVLNWILNQEKTSIKNITGPVENIWVCVWILVLYHINVKFPDINSSTVVT